MLIEADDDDDVCRLVGWLVSVMANVRVSHLYDKESVALNLAMFWGVCVCVSTRFNEVH